MHVRDTNNIYPVLRKRFWKQSLTCILEQGFLLLKNKMEIWKEIQGYPNYQVSNLGRVKSLKRNFKGGLSRKQETILKPRKTRAYLLVAIYNPTRKDISIHRLVGNAFIPNPEKKLCINHLDSNPSNNNVSNLEWVTYSENVKYTFFMKRRNVQGQNAPNSKLKNEDVLKIRELHTTKTPIKNITKQFNICKSSVNQIIARTTWSHI